MIISVFNQKGGVAKTTTTTNLAAALGQKNKKVLVVDLDPQANSTNALGLNEEELEHTVYDLITSKKVLKVEIQNTIVPTEYGIDLLPSDITLADAEQTLSNIISRELALKKVLKEIKDDYDYIILDCPPSLGLISINALAASDRIVVPVSPSYLSIKGLQQLINTFELVQENVNPGLEIMGLVLTKYDQRINKHKQIKSNLEGTFKNKVFKTAIRMNCEIEYAQDEQKPIAFYNTGCNGYNDYKALAEEVIQHG